MHVEDLINVGMVGLIEAIDKYNPENAICFLRTDSNPRSNARRPTSTRLGSRSVRDRSNQIAKAKHSSQNSIENPVKMRLLHLYMFQRIFNTI